MFFFFGSCCWAEKWLTHEIHEFLPACKQKGQPSCHILTNYKNKFLHHLALISDVSSETALSYPVVRLHWRIKQFPCVQVSFFQQIFAYTMKYSNDRVDRSTYETICAKYTNSVIQNYTKLSSNFRTACKPKRTPNNTRELNTCFCDRRRFSRTGLTSLTGSTVWVYRILAQLICEDNIMSYLCAANSSVQLCATWLQRQV